MPRTIARARLRVQPLEDRTTPATFAVMTTADAGAGSLRQAILDANATPGADAITFAIGTGVQTITPQSPLPGISDPVTIDGTTQPGFADSPLIELDGSQTGFGNYGLYIVAGNCTVRGLVVNRFSYGQILLRGPGATGNRIVGNYLGTDVTGTQSAWAGPVNTLPANSSTGVFIDGGANHNTVGGTTAADRNVISGNGHGLFLDGAGADDTAILGNSIGTDPTGTQTVANFFGIRTSPGMNRLTVAGNVISGSVYSDIYIINANDTTIRGNFIGTDRTGTTPLGAAGVYLQDTTGTVVGGRGAADRNVVNGTIQASGKTADLTVSANYVGVDATGLNPLASGSVSVFGGVQSNVLVGGDEPEERNVIAAGQVVLGTSSSASANLRLQGNYIGTDATGLKAIGGGGVVNYYLSPGVKGKWQIGGLGSGEGNVICGNTGGSGIQSNGAAPVILGNLIGVGADGSTVLPNANGITSEGGDVIRGNVISGNTVSGIRVYYDAVIQGNMIGTDVTGTQPRPNGEYGIWLRTNNLVGGTNPGEGNVISGNRSGGVVVGTTWGGSITDATDNRILGNVIGLNAAGTVAIPNGGEGVLLFGTYGATLRDNLVGSNVVAGNAGPGVRFYGPDVHGGNRVEGNVIGTPAFGNQGGVRVEAGARDVTVGGTAPGAGNVIRGNADAGVLVLTIANAQVTIRGNSIGGNGGLGIDLSRGGSTGAQSDGVTANDALDADTGANGLQNYPTVTFAQGGASTTVTGTLHSTPNATFTLDFYASATADPSGYGEGGRHLGSWTVTTDAAGNATFTATGLAATVVGEVITATATGADGTSEFSAVSAPVYNSPPTANAGGPYTVTEGGSVALAGSGSDPDQAASTLTYEWDLDNDGQFDDATGATPTFWAGGLDGYAGAFRTVRLRVTDTAGASHVSVATVNITNANPAPTIDSVGSVRVEGTAISVTGSATDPAGALDTLTFAWAVYKNGSATPFATGGNTASFSFTPDDNGSYRIVLTVSDEDGGSATTEQTIMVSNGAPTAAITGPTAGQQGAGLAFGSSVSDPGAADTAEGFAYSWQVSLGATPIDLTGAVKTNPAFAFVPVEAGTYTVNLTVTDKDGGATTVTRTFVVFATPGITLVDGVLTIIGTGGDDDIKVTPGGGAPEIKVNFNGAQTTYVGVTQIVVYANAGDDRVQIAGGVTVPVVAFGGTGNDRLKAGGGASILVGGDGDDILLGGSGRDVLIGGRGADLISGNGADDILVAGFTSFDTNIAALNLIREEWTSSRGFADRVANLSGTGTTGVNGAAVLRASGAAQTVFDDEAVDRLSGDAGVDWFVFHGTGSFADQVADMSEFEGLFDTDL